MFVAPNSQSCIRTCVLSLRDIHYIHHAKCTTSNCPFTCPSEVGLVVKLGDMCVRVCVRKQ